MLPYAFLAYAHHLLAFALVSILIAELVLVSGGSRFLNLSLLARLDGFYGITAVLLVVAGVSRLIWGEKGWEYAVGNHVFWGKMALFVLTGIISVWPTIRFIRWSRRFKADPAFVPGPDEIAQVRKLIYLQVVCLLPVPLLAAMFARGIGG